MGVKAGCKPRGDVLQGELDDAIFAASFDKLTRGEGPLIYRDPALFFQNTHPTAALSKLDTSNNPIAGGLMGCFLLITAPVHWI